MVGLQLAARDVIDDADGLQRVLVHRIGVVHVELGLADDPSPLRQKPAQQPGLVHHRQRAIRPLPVRQYIQEGAGRARVPPQPGRHQRQGPRHRRKGVGVQIQVVPVGQHEQAQQHDRIGGEHLRPVHRQPPVGDGDPRRVDPLLPPRQQRRRQPRQPLRLLVLARLQLGGQGAGQGAHVARHQEVASHEPLHRRLVAASAPAHAPRHLRLAVERQLLLGPPGQQVQVDAHPPQEVESLVKGPPLPRGQQRVHDGRAKPAFRRQRPRDPEQGVEVAQAALAVLDVGLDLVADGARLFVARGPLLQLGGDEGPGIGAPRHVAEACDQQVRQPGVPRQRPRLQQGGAHRHVRARQRQRLVHRPEGRADLEPQVPQHVQHMADHLLAPRRRPAGAHEQQVQVRERRQHPPPVSAHRQQRQPLGLHRRYGPQGLRRLGPQGLQHLVRRRRIKTRDLAPLPARLQPALGSGAVRGKGLAQHGRGRGAHVGVPRRLRQPFVQRQHRRLIAPAPSADTASPAPRAGSARRDPGPARHRPAPRTARAPAAP